MSGPEDRRPFLIFYIHNRPQQSARQWKSDDSVIIYEKSSQNHNMQRSLHEKNGRRHLRLLPSEKNILKTRTAGCLDEIGHSRRF